MSSKLNAKTHSRSVPSTLSRCEWELSGRSAAAVVSPSSPPTTSYAASCAPVSLLSNDEDAERTTDDRRRRRGCSGWERAPPAAASSLLTSSPPASSASNCLQPAAVVYSNTAPKKVTSTSITMVSTATSTCSSTTTSSRVACCDECQNVKNEVKAVREQLHFLTHQIAVLMRFLSIGCCRCPSCDAYQVTNVGDNGWHAGSTALRNTTKTCDHHLPPSFSQLLAAINQRTQQAWLRSHSNVAPPNEPSTSPSSSSSAAEKTGVVDGSETSNRQVSKKRRISGTVDVVENGVEDECRPEEDTVVDDEDCCSSSKRRIVCVDQLLPKLFTPTNLAGPVANGVDPIVNNDGRCESNEEMPNELVKRSVSEESDVCKSVEVDNANMEDTETRSAGVVRHQSSFEEKTEHESDGQQRALEGRSRDFVTPPAVLGGLPKDRFGMHLLHRPPPMLYPLASYGLMAGTRQPPPTSLLLSCCPQLTPTDAVKAIGDGSTAMERPQSLNDESPCSSNGTGGVELPRTCVDVLGDSALEAMYTHRNGLLLTAGHMLPATSVTAGQFLNGAEHQLKGFSPTGPPISAALPLVTQGPRMSTFFCTICNRDFSNVYYKRHMIVHANARPYVCDVCGKRFNERSNMMKHKQRLHGP